MRIVAALVGEDVGGLLLEGSSTLLIDPRLSRRRQVAVMAALLTDEEFLEVFSPFPDLSVATARHLSAV